MRQCIFLILMLMLLTSCHNRGNNFDTKRNENYVYIDNNHFAINGKEWFPLMINYKVDFHRIDNEAVLSPAFYYDDPSRFDNNTVRGEYAQMDHHFQLIEDLGFNTLRICMDNLRSDSIGHYYGNQECPIYICQHAHELFNGIDSLLHLAQKHQLRVMLLLKPPMDQEALNFTAQLMEHLSANPTLFAYDMFNEPLYFDTVARRSKESAFNIVNNWRKLRDRHAPHQLFTIGFSEPIEVFEWDPALLPVDFVQIHTYHPLRVGNETWWYAHYAQKPWMIGETALPADDKIISYLDQQRFMTESFDWARSLGACGYGWWEFQECPQGNYEGIYTGLYTHDSTHLTAKPATLTVGTLLHRPIPIAPKRPSNYYNMLGYSRWVIEGTIVDRLNRPVEGAVIRGWNEDWSIGQNTFSDNQGHYTLVSDSPCTHFEISAPCMSHKKFDFNEARYKKADGSELSMSEYQALLLQPTTEYQQIPLLFRLNADSAFFHYNPIHFQPQGCTTTLPTVKLHHLTPQRVKFKNRISSWKKRK